MVYSLWLKPQGNFSHSQYMTFWYMGIFWIVKDHIFWLTPQIGGANTYPEFNIGPIPWYYFDSLENGPRSPIHQFVLYYFMNFYCYCQRCTEINQNDKKGETPLLCTQKSMSIYPHYTMKYSHCRKFYSSRK